MTCREITPGAIICGPRKVIEVSRKPYSENAWCFVCRKRRDFVFVVRRADVEIDWYGPWPSVECSEGHSDGDLFPGRVREWE